MKSVPILLIYFVAGLFANVCAAADEPPEKKPAAPNAPEAALPAKPVLSLIGCPPSVEIPAKWQ